MRERLYQKESHSVIFALYRDGVILVEKRLEAGKWQGLTIIPGGHIEEGETQEDAMIREVRDEELGVTPIKFSRLGSIIITDETLGLKIKHIFLIEDWDGEISNPEDRNEHHYLTLSQARNICVHPTSQKVLDMVEEYLSR